jgi:hypothetical protein
MTRLTDQELSDAEKKAREATPGPWRTCVDYSFIYPDHLWSHPSYEMTAAKKCDALHIARMNPQFTLRLIAELKWARGMLERARVLVVKYAPRGTAYRERENFISDYERGAE